VRFVAFLFFVGQPHVANGINNHAKHHGVLHLCMVIDPVCQSMNFFKTKTFQPQIAAFDNRCAILVNLGGGFGQSTWHRVPNMAPGAPRRGPRFNQSGKPNQ